MFCNIIESKYPNKNIIFDINIHKTYIKPINYNKENLKSCFIDHKAASNGEKRLKYKNYLNIHSYVFLL